MGIKRSRSRDAKNRDGAGDRVTSVLFHAGRCGRTTEEEAMSAKNPGGFTAEERAAMRERARERKAEERARKSREEGERAVLARISEMSEPDRTMAERLHEIVTQNAPELTPRTWYGMPAYARDGRVLCFFQSAQKFKTRYATLGFSDAAKLDDGVMWPVSFALKELSAAEEARIIGLLKKALG